MSPRLQVPTLQECSLRYALTVIREGTFMCKGASRIKDERQYLIRVLHSGIRQQLINLAFHECRRDSNLMIEIVYLLLDGSIRCIAPTPEMEHLSTSQCMRLFCIMHQADATGLTELKITVNPRMKVAVEHTGMAPLNNLMSRGLARNLHTLVLRNTCDNAMLAQLGRHATCLSKLDIADNWLINEQGICQLLFKDSSSIHLPADLDDCDWMLNDLNRMPQDNLTRCCETLQEIRIQDTNTSGISVLMLLMFVKHLESLGGFLYYRNLGDCILAVKPFRSRLAITKLWDMHLPWEKMVAIGEVIGHGLHTLYTRVSQITAKQLPFTALRDLTIDFDYFVYEQAFVDFLATNGSQLTRLVLLDQGYNMDITVIANYCPQLVELAASTCLDNHFPHSELAHLKVARLKINAAQVFTWIMVNCPIIKKLAVRIEQDEMYEMHRESEYWLNNRVIFDLAEMGVPSLDTIEHLSIVYLSSPRERCDSNAIWTLVRACAQLRSIEDVATWQMATPTNLEEQAIQQQQQQYLTIAEDLIEQNYDVDVYFKHVSLTDFFRVKATAPANTMHTGVMLTAAFSRGGAWPYLQSVSRLG